VLDRLNAHLDAIRQIAAKEVLVVAGSAKSGTTWVQRMLNTHPEIYCPGEGKFGQMMAGLVKAVTEYNKSLAYTNSVVYREGHFYNTWDDDAIATAFQFMVALAWEGSNHKDLAGVRYIGDKDTLYAGSIEAWRDLLLPGARFIHVIRDGRDSAVSNVYHKQRADGRETDFGGPAFRTFLEGYARDWADSVRRVRAAFADRSGLYHEVRYEDLLAEPEARVTGILTFLGVDASPEQVARVVGENTFQKLSGGRASGQEDRASFYRKGVSGEWRTHFDEEALAVFDRASGGLLRELGYEA
jgi:hypothetical protein